MRQGRIRVCSRGWCFVSGTFGLEELKKGAMIASRAYLAGRIDASPSLPVNSADTEYRSGYDRWNEDR